MLLRIHPAPAKTYPDLRYRRVSQRDVLESSIETSFQPGDRIVCSPHGIGTIASIEDKASAGQCFILFFGNQLKVFLPVAQAGRMMRKLASPQEAERDLETLRGVCPDPAPGNAREVRQERQRILHHGSPTERATALRLLYAGATPASDAVAVLIHALEDLVLAEIAMVLDIPRGDLEGEMRTRYPKLIKPRKP